MEERKAVATTHFRYMGEAVAMTDAPANHALDLVVEALREAFKAGIDQNECHYNEWEESAAARALEQPQ